MNLQFPRFGHGNSLILILNQTLPPSIHHLQEPGLGISSLPINLPQHCAPKSSSVGGEKPAFFVERHCAGGELEGDLRSGGESEPLGFMIGGCARDVAVVVAVIHRHVRGGCCTPANIVEDGLFVGVENVPSAAFVVDAQGPEGFGIFEHCGLSTLYLSGVCVWSIGL